MKTNSLLAQGKGDFKLIFFLCWSCIRKCEGGSNHRTIKILPGKRSLNTCLCFLAVLFPELLLYLGADGVVIDNTDYITL